MNTVEMLTSKTNYKSIEDFKVLLGIQVTVGMMNTAQAQKLLDEKEDKLIERYERQNQLTRERYKKSKLNSSK